MKRDQKICINCDLIKKIIYSMNHMHEIILLIAYILKNEKKLIFWKLSLCQDTEDIQKIPRKTHSKECRKIFLWSIMYWICIIRNRITHIIYKFYRELCCMIVKRRKIKCYTKFQISNSIYLNEVTTIILDHSCYWNNCWF